jgi:predicted DCC family thiol-disulfide oxidoreductase YuxK
LLETFGMDARVMESLVLIEGKRCYMRSSAALRVVRYLGGLWPLLHLLYGIPRMLRDPFYDFVAKRRDR